MIRIKKSLYPEKLSSEQDEILNGLLLGDGHLNRNIRLQANTYLSITRKLDDKEYNYWVAEKFSNMLRPKSLYEKEYFDKRTNKTYYSSTFSSKTCAILNNYHAKWYNNCKKIVPQDLILTPLTIAVWLCDDGCVINKPNNKLFTKFATNSYSEIEVDWLIRQLNDKYNFKFRKSKAKNNKYVIECGHQSTIDMIEVIVTYIPDSMNRKKTWKLVLS